MEYAFGILVLLAIPVAGVAGFFMALRLRSRAALIEQRLAAVEAALGPLTLVAPRRAAAGSEDAQPAVRSPAPASPPPAPPAPEAVMLPPAPVIPAIAAAPPKPAAPPLPPPPRTGIEEQLGTRWAVWVGGLALGLGGLFLVRYSIEQGLLGPQTRVALGLLFALALIAAGEIMRRRETAWAPPGVDGAHIPSILTAAGTSTAFATAYAAYSLYDLIGPALAFVALGAIALLTLSAAALHGPALGALGLVAALASPLLIDSETPQLWPVVLYIAFVVFSAYGLARLRLWRWLAIAAGAGAALWGLLLIGVDPTGIGAIMAHVLIQLALAGLFLVADPHRRTVDSEARPDWLASGVLIALALLALIAALLPAAAGMRPVFAGATALMLLALALRFAAVAAAAAGSALIVVGSLALWPAEALQRPDSLTLYPDNLGELPRPEALNAYLAFGLLTVFAIAAGCLWRLSRGRQLPLASAGLLAGAATIGPLLALVCAYGRVAQLDRSLPFALAAGLLGLAFASAADWLRRHESEGLDAIRLAVGAAAAAAVAALALGLTFALEHGTLTVAFALAALGTAWVGERVRIPALRRVVGALGLLVLARLIWDPALVRGGLSATPIFNWLLIGYGVPSVAFFLAARILARAGRDWITRLMESLGLATAAFLAIFQIRHALYGGDPFAASSSHMEAGLLTASGLLFSLVLLRVNERRNDIVYEVALAVFTGGSLIAGTFGLALMENPFFTGAEVVGGAVFNSLLVAYALPALLAAGLAYEARRSRPLCYQRLVLALACGLQFLYMVLEIRRLFQGPVVAWDRATGESELYAYSAALLAIGIALLAVGLLRAVRVARIASAVYIVAAVAKVFLVDLANLEGVMRALSFIGLGLTLVGIGLAYQKLLVRRRPDAGAPAPAG